MTTTQKILIATIAVSVAVAVGTGVHGTRRVSRMQEEIRTLKQQQEPLTEQIQQLRQERDRARHILSVLQWEKGQPRDQAAQLQAPAAPSSTGTASNSFDRLEGMEKELEKDPKMKEARRLDLKMQFNKLYGALFKYLNLPADKLDALKDLIVDHEMARGDEGINKAMMSGSESERKQAMEEIEARESDYHKKIQDLLGAQNYKAFQDYEQTRNERMDVQNFEDILSDDAALTDQQGNDLIAAMHEEREASQHSLWLNRENQTPDQNNAWYFSEEGTAEQIKQLEQLQQACIKRAAAILTPAQLEQFKQWEQAQSVIEAANVKMAAQRFGKQGASQPPAGK